MSCQSMVRPTGHNTLAPPVSSTNNRSQHSPPGQADGQAWRWLGQVLCGLLLAAGSVSAADRILDLHPLDPAQVSLTEYFAVLEDSGLDLTLADVQKPEIAARFTTGQPPSGALNYGYTRSAYWLRLTLHNGSGQVLERMLELSGASLATIDFHQPNSDGTYRTLTTGGALPFHTRGYKNRYFVFPLVLPVNSTEVVYFRVRSNNPMLIPVRLWQPQAFHENERDDYFGQAWYFGMVTAMVLFNLLLFIALRDSIYILYVGFVSCLALAVASQFGLSKEFLWPDPALWSDIAASVLYSLTAAMFLLFMRRMLTTWVVMPRVDRVIKGLIFVHFASTIALAVAFHSVVKPLLMLKAATALLVLGIGLYCAYRRQRSAYFFVVAFAMLAAAVWVSSLKALGLVPTNIFTTNVLQFGSALEMLLLALALADRINIVRAENAEVRARFLVEQATANALASSNLTLESLGTIGREVTGNLDAKRVLEALDRHIRGLLEVTQVDIYLLDSVGRTLVRALPVEDDQHSQALCVVLDDPTATLARCARERVEIDVTLEHGDNSADHSPETNTQRSFSHVFAPLMARGQLLGVLSLQLRQVTGYGEREAAIVRALCSYGAIALANAHAYEAVGKSQAETARSIVELQKVQAQLIQTEKMASLGQLVANVAHEINTPIGAIKSSGQSVSEALTHAVRDLPNLLSGLDDDDAKAFLTLLSLLQRPAAVLSTREERNQTREMATLLDARGIDNPSFQATKLVQCRVTPSDLPTIELVLTSPRVTELLDVAYNLAIASSNAANINMAVSNVSKIMFALKSLSRQATSAEAVDTSLRESLEAVLRLYATKIRQGTELVTKFTDVPNFRANSDELHQVWTNLIHNALHAMGYRGVLTVALRQDGDNAMIEIGDTGSGIAPDVRERMFEPFFTTKPVGEGSGLGLSIVRDIVDRHGGSIAVKTEVGVGTTFSVTLPLRRGSQGHSA